MICANILIYYLLVTCCCCSRYLQIVSAASSSSSNSNSNSNQETNDQSEKYLYSSSNNNNNDENLLNIKNSNDYLLNENHKQQAANHHVHKLMSEKDLRRTFQVDSHDQVPEYEVLKLQVNQDGSHLISPISDLGELLANHHPHPHPHPHLHPNTHSNSYSNDDLDKQKLKSSLTEEQQDDNQQIHHSTRHKRESPSSQQQRQQQQQQESDDFSRTNDENNKLIVIDLTTFGKDFKLRLKRNADFQQRIKDMKMFMAESTQDGQLKYTEVNHPFNSASSSSTTSGKHKQEPHKRAANADDEPSVVAAELLAEEAAVAGDKKRVKDNNGSSSSGSSSSSSGGGSSNSNSKVWNIGSTYHDEDNLAALLIDHDKKTGQLQIEGTIGNDFVIKPVPKATIEALLSARRQQQQQQQQASPTSSGDEKQAEQQSATTAESNSTTSRLDRPSSPSSSSSSSSNSGNTGVISQQQQQQQQQQKQQTESSGDLDRAIHMHDDDPHDDDEMFLDEDEAIELAQIQHQSIVGNRTALSLIGDPHNYYSSSSSLANQTITNLPLNNNNNNDNANGQSSLSSSSSSSSSAGRILSKAASERKWNKYRKLLLAQTQVPKIQQQSQTSTSSFSSPSQSPSPLPLPLPSASSSSSSSQRARRQITYKNSEQPILSHMSHHIVFRQKPSSDGSSSEHQHSFMISPGSSMERLAFSFSNNNNNNDNDNSNQPRRDKRNVNAATTDDSITTNNNNNNNNNNEILSGPGGSSRLMMIDNNNDDDGNVDADSEHDPLGGQFYLEPASLTGFERAGHSDWSFQRNRYLMAPPYSAAFNHTTSMKMDGNYTITSNNSNNTNTTSRHRFKRHTGRQGPSSSPQQKQKHHQHQQHQQQPAIMVRGSSSQVRRKRQAPDTVWPEVLLVVDYDSFLLHGSDSRDVKKYFVSFWNGVDLRYKLLVHPHIRISLAGMIVAKDRDATPYLERNRLRAPNADAVDAAGALTDMGKYLYREDRLPTYDLAVVITKLDMCRRRFEGGRCNRGTAGFAYVGGACVVNKRLEKVNSVAIIEDSGGFSGIIVAAHEVGHLLGCVHDGSPPPSYLGGPGATHCPWEDGFIMSDLRHTERGFRWSQCSVEQFKHFLNGETATCLYNYPHESQMLQRLLPGTMLSLDEQCKRDRGTNACFKDARVCAQLFCFDSASGYCVSYRPAAEGSPCGEGQVCRNGKCVGEIENIIPDYTHQSQTVVARGRSAPATAVASHGLVRLADNGLSASSTSTATSSPDGKQPTVAQQQQQSPPAAAVISSRMDTYPIDSPLIGVSPANHHYSSASYASQFGGRQFGGAAAGIGHTTSANGLESMTSSSAGLVMSRQRHPVSLQTSSAAPPVIRSAKLIVNREPQANNNKNNKHHDKYQQRSGQLQMPQQQQQQQQQQLHKTRSLHQQSKQNNQMIRGNKQQVTVVNNNGGLRASASTLSHQRSQLKHPSSSTTPSLLSQTTPKTSISIGNSKSNSNSNSNSNNNNSNDNNDNLLAISHNQFNHNHHDNYQPQPSTSSIKAANSGMNSGSSIKHRSASYHSNTTPRHSIQTPDDGDHVDSNINSSNSNNNIKQLQQQFTITNVNHAQYEPQKSSNSKATTDAINHGSSSPAVYMISASSSLSLQQQQQQQQQQQHHHPIHHQVEMAETIAAAA